MCIRVRTTENYYDITPSKSNKCFSAKINQVDLWHQRLGHASHKQLEKISKCDVVIGCLLYLTASCPNIAFTVGICSRFQSNPKVSHLNVV